MNPQFPIYIPSKSRWQSERRFTIRALEAMRVPFKVIVEAQQYDEYAKVVDPSKLLVLPAHYQANYDTFDELGDTKSKGPGAARNFAWDHAIVSGYAWHWVIDDNIRYFSRHNNNYNLHCADGTLFKCMEDFCLRYKNVAMAGPNYESFIPRRLAHRVMTLNTRIYSCNLIRNDVPFRWRGRYNEDTDLSLQMLKAGWCTVQFNAFLQKKIATQLIQGGNTEEFYRKEGTRAKSEMLVRMHPDVAKLKWRFNRIHHIVDYGPFEKLKLIRKPDVEIQSGPDNYGMELIRGKWNGYTNGRGKKTTTPETP